MDSPPFFDLLVHGSRAVPEPLWVETFPRHWPWRPPASGHERALERAHAEEIAGVLRAISRVALRAPDLAFARHFEGGASEARAVRRAARSASARTSRSAVAGIGLVRTYAHRDLGRNLAAECARAALRLVPSVGGRLILAAHLDDLGRDAEARALAEESLAVGDRASARYAWARLGHLASKHSRNHEALEHYRAGAREPGHLVNALSWLVSALHVGDFGEVGEAVAGVRELERDADPTIAAEFPQGVRRAKQSIGWSVGRRSTQAILAVRDDAPDVVWRILDAFR